MSQERPPAHAPAPSHAERRPPTAAEARALAHPMRLRILFACRDRARTNKELAAGLDTTPGTIHYHLKPLVEEGFLRAEEPRPGPRGSTEQPYRSTGKSWQVAGTPESGRVLREVGATEVLNLRQEDEVALSRLGMRLSPADLDDLHDRIGELVEDFAARSLSRPDVVAAGADTAEGVDVTLFVSLHRNRDPDAFEPTTEPDTRDG